MLPSLQIQYKQYIFPISMSESSHMISCQNRSGKTRKTTKGWESGTPPNASMIAGNSGEGFKDRNCPKKHVQTDGGWNVIPCSSTFSCSLSKIKILTTGSRFFTWNEFSHWQRSGNFSRQRSKEKTTPTFFLGIQASCSHPAAGALPEGTSAREKRNPGAPRSAQKGNTERYSMMEELCSALFSLRVFGSSSPTFSLGEQGVQLQF